MIALSSSFKTGLIAVDIKNKKDFCEIDANCSHSEKILLSLDNILEKNQLKLKDNESFAVVIGPGSFTGIRIAISVVKGLCAGTNKKFKIFPITSFELMAYTYINKFSPKADFTCIIDALSGKVFACKFNYKGEKIGKEEIISKDLIQDDFVSLIEENLSKVLINPTAKELLNLAITKEAQNEIVNVENLSPLYLRKSQAEDDLEKREKNLKKT